MNQINKWNIFYFFTLFGLILFCYFQSAIVKNFAHVILNHPILTLCIISFPIIILFFELIQSGAFKHDNNSLINYLLDNVKFSTIGITIITLSRELFMNHYFSNESMCQPFDWYVKFGIIVSVVTLSQYWFNILIPLMKKVFQYSIIVPDRNS